MSTRTFLVHGLLAGLLAGVAAFVVAYTVGEPQVERAIALESAGATADHHHEGGHPDGTAHSHDDGAVFSRTTQSTLGLATGTLAVGLVLGGFTGLVAAAGLGRLGSLRPAGSTALVVLLGAVAFSLVPFLKYPATPPGVGSGETIDTRTALWSAFVAVSLVSVVAAVAGARRAVERWGAVPGVVAGVATYVAAVAVAALVLPEVDELGDFPAGPLWDFRVASLLTLLATWAVIGAVLVVLVDRSWRRHSELEARRAFAASL